MTTAPTGGGLGVAVVIPCRNAARWIGETLDALAQQSLPPTEVILVDDGSSDGSALRAQEWSRDHPGALFALRIMQQAPAGVAAAVNRGVHETDQPLIVRVDADDLVAPTFLASLSRALSDHPAAGYAYCAMQMFGDATGRYHVRDFDAAALVLEGNFVGAGSLMRREAFLAAGGVAQLPAWEDWDLWLSFLDAGYEGVFVAEDLYFWRRHGLSRNRLSLAQRRALRLRIWWRHRQLVRRYFRRGLPLMARRLVRPLRQQ